MSNVAKSKEDLVKLREYIQLIKDNKGVLSRDIMNHVLRGIVPKDNEGNKLVKYQIGDYSGKTALFPKEEAIHFNIRQCNEWVLENANSIGNFVKIQDTETFRNYLSLFVLLHEVEHCYQKLMGDGKIESPCILVKEGYKALTNIMVKPNYILPHPIKKVRRYYALFNYYRHQLEYALERNASIESFDSLLGVALLDGNEEMQMVMRDLYDSFIIIGYTKDRMGSFYHSFKGMRMMDTYNRIDDGYKLSDEEKIRYGLIIKEEERRKLLLDLKRRTF